MPSRPIATSATMCACPRQATARDVRASTEVRNAPSALWMAEASDESPRRKRARRASSAEVVRASYCSLAACSSHAAQSGHRNATLPGQRNSRPQRGANPGGLCLGTRERAGGGHLRVCYRRWPLLDAGTLASVLDVQSPMPGSCARLAITRRRSRRRFNQQRHVPSVAVGALMMNGERALSDEAGP